MDERVGDLEEEIRALKEERAGALPAQAPKPPDHQPHQPQPESMEDRKQFQKARKSLKISPCENNLAAIKEFLEKEMKVPARMLETMHVINTREIFAKNLPEHRRTAQTRVSRTQFEMSTIEERDLLVSFASNLKGGASIDIVIPDTLRSLAARFDHYAYRYRQQAKLEKREAKTQGRFCNKFDTIVLGIRPDKEARWDFYPFEKLPKLASADNESMEGFVRVDDK